MGEFSKYKRQAVGCVLTHNNRTADDGHKHANEKIDLARTDQNYHFQKGSVIDLLNRLDEIRAQDEKGFNGRRDAVVMGEWIITLGDKVALKDETRFFRAAYEYCVNDVGAKNVINAVVHKDETKPHLHFDFVPVVEVNGVEKLNCRNYSNYGKFHRFHIGLSKYLTEALGYDTGVLNGATVNGNKTVLELKVETLKDEVEGLEAKKRSLGADIQQFCRVLEKSGIEVKSLSLIPLISEISNLKIQNGVLKDILTKANYTLTKSDIEAFKKSPIRINSSHLNIIDASYNTITMEDNAVVIIETYRDEKRESPQKAFIDRDEELREFYEVSLEQDVPMVIKHSRKANSNKTYIFLKTDSAKETIDNMILLQSRLVRSDYKKRPLYMESFSNDEYDFARSMLEVTDINAKYLIRKKISKEQTVKQKERT